jgi:hypothetical protein
MTDLNADFDDVMDGLPDIVDDNVVQMPPPPPERTVALPPSVLAQWMKFREQLAASEEGRFFDIGVIEAGLLAGKYAFWPGREAAMITEMLTFPNGERAIQVTWATGELQELLGMAAGVEAWARLQGCSHALVEGRPGWKRPLKVAGYAPWSETLHKAL